MLVNNVNAETDNDIQYMPEFQNFNGETINVETLREWALHVSLLKRPARKSAPKYVSPSQSPSKTKSKSDKIKDKGSSQLPTSVNIWYAARGTHVSSRGRRIQARCRFVHHEWDGDCEEIQVIDPSTAGIG